MITIKNYLSDLKKVQAICYSGNISDAEALEAMFKGRIRLEFRGCFTGRLMIENHGRARPHYQELYANPGDYIIIVDEYIFPLSPEIFDRYYRAAK